ncbi:hypothetical protein CCACVL1_04042 [Corchorus capsularis]|uniref:Uncharacterized protein n=1 Tax=Corchorus capsularis TaxID=210143 RepID=A0A1R3JVB5_COCAP|nr:hypothetical protein CCACVL1_04042 [Corchorus capsularis]
MEPGSGTTIPDRDIFLFLGCSANKFPWFLRRFNQVSLPLILGFQALGLIDEQQNMVGIVSKSKAIQLAWLKINLDLAQD